MRLGILLSVLLFSTVAWSGDPCPIQIYFNDMGSPPWLAANPPLARLKRQEMWVGIRYTKEDGNIVVKRVHEGSPADRASLHEDDIIQKANGQRIASVGRLEEVFDTLKPKDPLLLLVKRKGTMLELKLEVDAWDPLIHALFLAAQQGGCYDPSYKKSDQLTDEEVMNAVFKKNRSFRCKDAHRRLNKTEGFVKDEIVSVRGARRVLIAMVGWKTICVDAAAYDGKVPGEKLANLLFSVLGDFEEEQYRNP